MEGVVYLAFKTALDFCALQSLRSGTGLVTKTKLLSAIGRGVGYELKAHQLTENNDPLLVELDKKIAEAKGTKRDVLTSRRRRHIERRAKAEEDWDVTEKRVGLVLYDCMAKEGLLTVVPSVNQGPEYCDLADEVRRILNSNLDAAAKDSPIWAPLVIPPREWKTGGRPTYSGGYHYALRGLLPFIKRAPRGFSAASCPEVVKAVNAVQKTAYRINVRIFRHAAAFWQRKDDALNTRFFRISRNIPKEKIFWQKYGVHKSLCEAHDYLDESTLYFVHTIDSRGRVYPQATYLNPQGADLSRALFVFAEGKPIEDREAERWLANHGACCYGGGLSRKTYDERLAWVRDHDEGIRHLADAPFQHLEFWGEADKPWGFLAWCLEWVEYRKAGLGFVSHLPVAVDGTCNGFQHLAALTRSSDIAARVNLLPGERPNDLYQAIADEAKRELDARAPRLRWYADLSLGPVK